MTPVTSIVRCISHLSTTQHNYFVLMPAVDGGKFPTCRPLNLSVLHSQQLPHVSGYVYHPCACAYTHRPHTGVKTFIF